MTKPTNLAVLGALIVGAIVIGSILALILEALK